MRTATATARKSASKADAVTVRNESEALLRDVLAWLDEAKAESITTIDLRGKSSMGDFMVVASGRSDRHVGSIADQISKNLKEQGHTRVRVEGQPQCDWVVIDVGDILVHVFRPEVREFYNLEKMWSPDRTPDTATH
jgi:ribosome-associated protein